MGIPEINKAWNWKGIIASEVIKTNAFGNIIFKTTTNEFWRICPEELSCEKIAHSVSDLDKITSQTMFKDDWGMTALLALAKVELGELAADQRFCLKIPGVLGGTYERTNLGKINFTELIQFSGDLAFQIKDLKDGQKITLSLKNQKF
jgi:hypothetical protein